MRLLLDEFVTKYLKSEFVGHDVSTVDDAAFKGLKNGELLKAASESFDALITVDQNLRFQQNLKDLQIAILLLKAGRTTFPFLKPLVPAALEKLETIAAGEIVIIE